MIFLATVANARRYANGDMLASALRLTNPEMISWVTSSDSAEIQTRQSTQTPLWRRLEQQYVKAMWNLYKKFSPLDCLLEYNKMASTLAEASKVESVWIVPALRAVSLDLVKLAAPHISESREEIRNVRRTLNTIFAACNVDREPLHISKRQAVYYIAVLIFQLDFRLKSFTLADGLLTGITQQQSNYPSLLDIPRNDRAAFLYYKGVLEFKKSKYEQAVRTLLDALKGCPRSAIKAQERILVYLIPARLVTEGRFPKKRVWTRFPGLAKMFRPIFVAARSGNYRLYRKLVDSRRRLFIANDLYIVFEKISVVCLLRLCVLTWKLSGRGNRLAVDRLVCSFEFAGYFEPIELTEEQKADSVELTVARLIENGDIKGYISHSQRMVVLRNQRPFPLLAASNNSAEALTSGVPTSS